MNENTEGGSRRGGRHRRGRGRDGRNTAQPQGQTQSQNDRSNSVQPAREQGNSDSRLDPRRDIRRDARDPRDSRDVRDTRDDRREPKRPLPVKIEYSPPPVLPTPMCSRCGEPIQDVASALSDRDSGAPMHFDCVVKFLEGAENLGANEKIVYIGQGRFAVMFFENPVDTRKFKIVRTIEWEKRESKAEWRAEISSLYSQVH